MSRGRLIKLGLDLDGVLFDFNSAFVELAKATFPDVDFPAVSDKWPDNWDYMDDMIGKTGARILWNKIVTSKVFWMDLPFYPHARALLTVANQYADELYFITARAGKRVQQQSHEAIDVVMHWLPTVRHGAVIPVAQAEHKTALVHALRLTHYVDDKIETVLDVNSNTGARVAIWDRPWNRRFPVPPAVTIVKNEVEVEKWITS